MLSRVLRHGLISSGIKLAFCLGKLGATQLLCGVQLRDCLRSHALKLRACKGHRALSRDVVAGEGHMFFLLVRYSLVAHFTHFMEHLFDLGSASLCLAAEFVQFKVPSVIRLAKVSLEQCAFMSYILTQRLK